MRIGVYSHCTIDSITVGGRTEEHIGGAACYCSAMARAFKFDVVLHTKFGPDFPSEYFEQDKIKLVNAPSERPTSRFRLVVNGADRELYLQARCDEIGFAPSDADGIIASPLYGEISSDTFEQIKKDSEFVLLDPQGFLRKSNPDGRITLESARLDLSGVAAIKASSDELKCLTGSSGPSAMAALRDSGVGHVLYTAGREISMLSGDSMYSLRLPERQIRDTTGVGDIFSAAFACIMLRERDPLWAFCFAGGAAQAALESCKTGLEKVPRSGAVESNASYFYNTVKFANI